MRDVVIYDVVVDDPCRLARHEIRGLEAKHPAEAGLRAFSVVLHREGPGNAVYRPTDLPPSFIEVARQGEHSDIDYMRPAPRMRLLGYDDPETGYPAIEFEMAS